MDDKAALLNQLRIDRTEPPRSGSARIWIVVAALVVISAGTGGWFWWRSSDIPVRVVEPQPVLFCQRLIEAGYPILCRSDITFSHVGRKAWKGKFCDYQRSNNGRSDSAHPPIRHELALLLAKFF